ncbi:PAS domain S-box protein [Nostocaceae cyanobacterium CENA369]|uniref:histidine kinase n=1 Tax=Dendronalium phyllosphericum CENA369 TaxID=1725256 RepID=A0A8J7ICX7_9NOST|nr:ATP-binding protein [Dendronalium phyllosphericum]MBH8577283.1 PAS domain S-box protein [Dendronalium phyllosphericum CENA369]
MQRPQEEIITVENIVITEELDRRNSRAANLLKENQALQALARQLVNQPQTMLQSLVDKALELCIWGTAGVSLLEVTANGEEIFCAHVLAGVLAEYLGGTTPRDVSPCGVCLERGTPQLYSYPERYFTYLQAANTPIVEELVLPLIADNHALGTIWIMSHSEQQHFDSEDVRVMTSLADFAAAALLLNQRQTQELLAKNAQLEVEAAERQRAEELARESETYLRAMIENLPGGAAFVVDRNLRYVLAEGEALHTAGFKSEDLVGKTIFDVLPPELTANYEVNYRIALAGEGFEHEHNAHNRSYISRGTPLRADNGEIYAVLVVSYDITERKRAEVALRESEERLSLFVTASSDIVYRMSADWREMLSLTGKNFLIDTNEPRATWIETYIPPEEQPRVWAAIQNAIRTQSTFELEYQVIRQDGVIGWTFSRAIPMLNEQGDIVEWFGTASDVTQQKHSEEALRESEERFRTLANTAPALIWYNDAQGNNLFINQYFLDFTGKSAEEIRGEGWRTLVHPDDAELYIADYLAAVREQQSWHNRNRIRRHDGVWRWHDNYAQPLFNADGVYLGHVGVTIDNTNAIEAEIALRESEAKLAVELADTKQLQFISSQLVQEENIDALYGQILEAAIALMRSEMGSMQLLHPDRNELQLLSWKGFDPASAAFWEWVQVDSDSTCGVALNTGERAIVPDVEKSEFMAGSRDLDAYRRSGIRAVQSTPLICRNSRIVGMISTHWLEPHQPSERELGLLDVLARQAADLIEQRQAEEALQTNKERMRGQKEAFQAAVNGAPLADSLAILARLVAEETAGEARTAFYIANADGTNLHPVYGAGSMPDAYLDRVNGFANGEDSLACGLAIPIGRPVLTRDVNEEALWQPWVQMAEAFNYRGCWSFPIVTRDDRKGVGTFAMYFYQPREATPSDLALAEIVTQSAAVIINSHFEAQERTRAEQALRESEEKYRTLFESIDEGFYFAEAIFDAEGRCMDLFYLEENPAAVYQDITDRKRQEEALRESEERLRDVLNSMTEGFALLGGDFTILDVNEETLRLDGRSRDELIGRTHWDAFPGTEDSPVGEIFMRVARERIPASLEHVYRWSDGRSSWLDMRAYPTRNNGVAIFWRDVTDRKRAEAALRESELQRVQEQSEREQERQRAESLAELDRAKTLFFSNVSHEFRTPLTLLLAPLSDALSDSVNPLPQAQQERLEFAHRNSLRLQKLVNTLLDFSRIEAGRMEAVYEPTDLALYTTELASVFRSAIERAGLRLVVDCPPISEPVYVDREMWEKIVLNLLSNAFKFTLEGEIAVRLHLADDHHVTLQVEDTGSGIEPEELPHVFERFYQVRRTIGRTHEGSGIGLALVQELIKMHSGTIDVSSTVGQGTCFTVTIPLGTAHLPSVSVAGRDSARRIQATRTLTSTALGAAPYVQEAERWIGEEAGEQGAGSRGSEEVTINNSLSPPAHILIVDDNADMRDYLTRILSEHLEVQAVADGAAALAAVNERVPDLVLSDVMMPFLDGFELLQALRADARTKEVPIILLSARAGEESVIEGLQAGADDYLIKPFSATELVTRVNAYLQLAHLCSVALRQERTINRRKDEVLSVVSHELNTPLVAILGWTRLLRSNPPSPAMLAKALEIIERNATLQAKLVEDLLDISRITAGKICLNLEPVQLQGVIESAIATVCQCKTKDIHLDCQLAVSPLIVQGDSERLQQIILNLLTNAVKFTPNGGRVEVNLESNENQALIVISDTGCGIDAEFLPYIFDTFCQAPSTKKGLGLGLAIARSLVELHDGTIHAHSPGVGQGTTFIVKLPLI